MNEFKIIRWHYHQTNGVFHLFRSFHIAPPNHVIGSTARSCLQRRHRQCSDQYQFTSVRGIFGVEAQEARVDNNNNNHGRSIIQNQLCRKQCPIAIVRPRPAAAITNSYNNHSYMRPQQRHWWERRSMQQLPQQQYIQIKVITIHCTMNAISSANWWENMENINFIWHFYYRYSKYQIHFI